MVTRRELPVVVLLAVFLCLPAANATPIFRIGTQAEWQAALSDGRIKPVPGPVFEQMVREEEAWPPEYQSALFFTPELYVMGSPWQGEPGLVMAWGPPEPLGQDTRMAAAWDYVYPQDPNLKNTVIEFSIFPPVVSTLFSLNIVDQFGNYREWIWHAGGPGEVPAGQWSTLVIDPVTGASNWPTFAGSPFIHNVPGSAFDLSSITILRFDENITGGFSNFFPPPEGGQGLPPFWVWNAWDHVAVQPEPSTLLLIGGGLLALAGRRRKRG
ncbi:MAG TPA: PEP-CTERM sorting domain-containing protein [Planctomycetota bacterium]|nr:PEP-CTERM sorting domain-containing protein [Planctomycetota bacterium]HRR79232.1 PEP-CTERM sorting domain-containing protein [Planctomycetota bacterium]HRT94275.1 PEP-CTERM sorting domain-containing protein [Planctomycetota bacterium]